MTHLTSAGGFLALLDEEPELKIYALENLNGIVNEFWAEIAFSIGKMCVSPFYSLIAPRSHI
jgi:26S proteasome regulatory subunit N2